MSLFSSTATFLFSISFALLALVYIFYPDKHNFERFFAAPSCTPSLVTTTAEYRDVSDISRFNLFFGIITRPHLHERRQFLRMVYSLQKTHVNPFDVDVRFILCQSMGEETEMLITLEIMRYRDIIVLNCTENLNEGKTYTYFSSLPSVLDRHYDYVLKADDDAYVLLDNLAKFLIDKPREDLFYGFEVQCDYIIVPGSYCGKGKTFMAGFTYVLSWDLVEWISESDFARNNKVGLEDIMLAKWLNTADKAKNRYNAGKSIYDYKEETVDGYSSHNLIPETVSLHGLKDNKNWIKCLKYFNVTTSLRPSKLFFLK